MDANLRLTKAQDEIEVDATAYRRTIGCLRYLLHTRPDLGYVVGVLSRFMESPRESHALALKHLLRYVQGTVDYGLEYQYGGDSKLLGFSDSSHNIDPEDGKSTTGHIFYLGSSPITWSSQKQQTVALSSCEAEFMAATTAACQAIWLQDLLSELLGYRKEKVVIKVDNMSALALTKNPVLHGKTKHIHTKYHFIRECVENDQVRVEYVPGVEQRADILTKPLAKIKFELMRNLIPVVKLESPNIELKGGECWEVIKIISRCLGLSGVLRRQLKDGVYQDRDKLKHGVSYDRIP